MKRRLIHRRGLAIALALTVPLLFALNVRQAFRFTSLQARIATIIADHNDLIAENTRLIVTIAALERPARIREIARDQLEMAQAEPERIDRVRLQRSFE